MRRVLCNTKHNFETRQALVEWNTVSMTSLVLRFHFSLPILFPPLKIPIAHVTPHISHTHTLPPPPHIHPLLISCHEASSSFHSTPLYIFHTNK